MMMMMMMIIIIQKQEGIDLGIVTTNFEVFKAVYGSTESNECPSTDQKTFLYT